MRCDVCDSDNQVRHITNLYTRGSEGTCLCNSCCVIVSNLIRGMMTMAQGIRKEAYKKWRK